jgi:hypothetical protein
MATTFGLWKHVLLFASFSFPLLLVSATLPDGRPHGNILRPPGVPIVNVDTSILPQSPNGTQLPPITTTYIFEQLIDHNNPSLGTFKQRYWHTWEFYKPGEFVTMAPSYHLTFSRGPNRSLYPWGI